MGVDWQSVWRSQGIGAYLLSPLAGLYATGWLGYLAIYRLGFKRAYRSKSRIVTIGNLRVGGSGKTPMTIHVAGVLLGLGRQVVISTSGYGFPRQESATLAPAGPLDVHEWGDEATLIREALPDVPMIVGRDRVVAAKLAETHFPDHVLLLDDGFQHLRLAQPLTVLLDDPRPANAFCLPAGPFREPRGIGRKRAKLILPDKFKVVAENLPLVNRFGNPVNATGEVSVLTAIAQPDKLHVRLTDAGMRVRRSVHLPDHDPMSAGTLLASFAPSIPIIVTRKDWVKLRERSDLDGHTFWIADYQSRIEPAEEFRDWIEKHLNEL